jgi:hypothetical protein
MHCRTPVSSVNRNGQLWRGEHVRRSRGVSSCTLSISHPSAVASLTIPSSRVHSLMKLSYAKTRPLLTVEVRSSLH